MKLNKLILISIFFLAVLTLGVVCANEDVDNIDVNDSTSHVDELSASVDDEIISDVDVNDVSFDFPDKIRAGEIVGINVTLPKGASGYVNVYVDNNDEIDGSYYVDSFENTDVETRIGTMGNHFIKLKFISKTPKICGNFEKTKKYYIDDYIIDIYSGDSPQGEFYFGEEYGDINLYVPAKSGLLDVYINNAKYSFDMKKESNNIYIESLKFNTTQVNVKVNYKGDGGKFKPKSFSKVFYVNPSVEGPSEIQVGDSGEVIAKYANGEQINFALKCDGNIIDQVSKTVTSSKAVYLLPNNLKLGNYAVEIYGERFNVTHYVNIVPKMNIYKMLWDKKDYNVSVEFSQEYKNFNATVKYDDEIIFNGIIGDDSKINFTWTNLTENWAELVIDVFDGESVIYKYREYIEISAISPADFEFNAFVSELYIQGADIYLEFDPDYGNHGDITVLIDGVEVDKSSLSHDMVFYIPTKELDVNIAHNLTLLYSGDDYFDAKRFDASFNLVPYIVYIPENPYYNWAVEVSLPKDATGTLWIYVDGKKVKTLDVAHDYDDDYKVTVHSYMYKFSTLNLATGSHDVRVVYKGNKQAFDVREKINLSYSIWIDVLENYAYGEKNNVWIYLPSDAKASFTVTIDGKKYTNYRKYIEDSECVVEVDVSQFFGKHEIVIDYPGDSKYNYPLKVNQTFDIGGRITTEDLDVPYKSDLEYVSLVLPNDAEGNLVVEIDGKVYAKKALVNGKAAVSFSNLSLGIYKLKAYFDNENYNVSIVKKDFCIVGIIKISKSSMVFNEGTNVYLNLPDDANGTLVVSYNDNFYFKDLINGFAEITISNLDLGYGSITAQYCDDGKYEVDDEWFEIDAEPIVEVSPNWIVFGDNSVSVTTPSNFKGKLFVEINNKEFYSASVVNGKAKISIPVIASGKNRVYVHLDPNEFDCVFSKVYNIKVAKASSSKAVAKNANVYYGNSYKVGVYNAKGKPIKNAKVFFTIGKKTYKKFTDKKGFAYLKMNFKPAKYKVTVKYLKQKSKVKVVVKHVVNLNTIKVKKSAKKLVLKATLKKGKTLLKNKKVTFKFNGKKYAAKTNKKGIAKVIIKKSVLKKLKVGKKVKYQATYLKDTVKKSVKVKR